MGSKILVTGGAGYIGGSVLAELLSQIDTLPPIAELSTTVRSADQIESTSKLGVKVLQLDLDDEESVVKAVSNNEINVVVHTASSAIPAHVQNLIRALGLYRRQSGKEVYFIHSGITALFTEEGGWPAGEVKDSDNLYETQKQIGSDNPVRAVDIIVVEESKAQEVTSFNLVVPTVYGTGSGQGRKISVNIPAVVRTAIKHKTVYKFDKDAYSTFTHITDLSKLYTLLISKILSKESIPSGEQGYYFAFSHRANWWTIMDHLAVILHTRSLISSSEPQIWPSYEAAAESLGWPIQHIRTMGTHGGQQVAINAYKYLGWQPEWDEQRFLESMDDEVESVLRFDVKPTLFKPLMETK